ncbi:MAG TPA: hypothetical protein VGA21_02600 [Cyclobacteriaceae bacterium]|jgi:argonaute-like protein implicated in RNA metabolism and viral defense
MDSAEKKTYLLLLSVIFHYHGLDKEEEELLNEKAELIHGREELKWVDEFISKDYIHAFENAREYLKIEFPKIKKSNQIKYMEETWRANLSKGFITEMEARAMVKLARDWGIEKELLEYARKTT